MGVLGGVRYYGGIKGVRHYGGIKGCKVLRGIRYYGGIKRCNNNIRCSNVPIKEYFNDTHSTVCTLHRPDDHSLICTRLDILQHNRN